MRIPEFALVSWTVRRSFSEGKWRDRGTQVAILYFLAALAAIVFIAVIVSSLTGARSQYIEDWKPDAGERILYEDREADIYPVGKLGEATFTTYGRWRRGFVIVTNRRIIAGQRILFGRKSVIQQMLYPEAVRAPGSEKIGGGLLTRGYQTLLLEPGGIERRTDGKKPFVLLTPSPAAASSFNLAALRIYTDRAALFPLPDETRAA